jgi:hypothetical protein
MTGFSTPPVAYRRHLNGGMRCPEYLRLREEYEVALRRWGHVMLSPDVHRLSAEIKQKVFGERNAAKKLLDDHTTTCPVCNPKLRRIRRSLN